MPNPPASDQRRNLLQSAAGLALAPLAATAAAAPADGPAAPAPTGAAFQPPPGRPGDFDFLAGAWKISHRRLKTPGGSDWDLFEGEATCWTILGGVGSVEELRIPARGFAGMGLRLLDMERRVWADHWVNAKSGVLTLPGMPGGFRDGVGLFEADDSDGDQPIKVRGIWDRITPRSCRWQQAVSRDGGRHWEPNWVMDWVRA